MTLRDIADNELARRKSSGEIPDDQSIEEVLDDGPLVTVVCQTKTFSFDKPRH